MERVLSTEERIRRAEEVYRNKGNVKERNIGKNIKSKNKMLKKMIIQIIVCLGIYSLFYFFQNTDQLFSKDMINRTKEIMEYDINFEELYNKFINWLNSNNIFVNNAENEITNTISNEVVNQIQNEIDLNEVSNNTENIGGAVEEKVKTNLSQMEIDANDIKSKYTLVKPIQGTITSRFGYRETTTATVPKNHTGTDIAANLGTKIKSATDGEVVLASEEGDYGKHLKIQIGEVSIIYAHCNNLYVKQGDIVKQGQEIAEVGSTGNSTRTTSTF